MNMEHELNTVQTLQPLVSRDCRSTDLIRLNDTRSTFLSFGSGDEPELRDLISVADLDQQGISEMIPGASKSLGSMNHTMMWLDPPKGTSTKYSVLTAEKQSYVQANRTMISACVIRAYWAEASIKYNTSAWIVESELTKMPNVTYKDGEFHSNWTGFGTPIAISPDSARALAQLYADQPNLPTGGNGYILSNAPHFLALGLSDAVPEGETCSQSLDAILAGPKPQTGGSFNVHIGSSYMEPMTECLALEQADLSGFVRQQGIKGGFEWLTISVTNNWTDPSKLTQLAVHRHALGYGYDTATVPVRLSLAALCLYCLLALIYLAIMLVTGRTSSSWDSVSQLFMLGMNSTMPDHLEKTSVGIETLSTFREPISIRVLGERSVNVVFNNDADLAVRDSRRVVRNERF